MALIGNFELIRPDQWLLQNHGDVIDGRRRADAYFAKTGSYDGAEFTNEEFVRQWALSRLISVYGYPKEWLGERLIIEEPVKMGASEKQADISLRNANGRPFLYIETKVPAHLAWVPPV